MSGNAPTIGLRGLAPRVLSAAACALFPFLLILPVAAYAETAASENAPSHASTDHSGQFPVGDAHALTLMLDLGSVHIVTETANAQSMVRYSIHLETDAPEPMAHFLFEHYVLNMRSAGGTLLLNGFLPRMHGTTARTAQFWVQYTVYIPANFSSKPGILAAAPCWQPKEEIFPLAASVSSAASPTRLRRLPPKLKRKAGTSPSLT